MDFGRAEGQVYTHSSHGGARPTITDELGQHEHVLRPKAGLGHSIFANREYRTAQNRSMFAFQNVSKRWGLIAYLSTPSRSVYYLLAVGRKAHTFRRNLRHCPSCRSPVLPGVAGPSYDDEREDRAKSCHHWSIVGESDQVMRYWWVNQNQTYRAETRGCFMWSPKQNANGARNQFYENMREVSPGALRNSAEPAEGQCAVSKWWGPKCRFAKARPDPDFRYRSKRKACSSVGNSMTTTKDQGRYSAVCPQGPWLCHSSRLSTSLVTPT